jgi:hypothetical protein
LVDDDNDREGEESGLIMLRIFIGVEEVGGWI